MPTTDTKLQQLVINVGTKAQIDAAIAGGTITQDMLSVTTDGDTYIQGVKVNGTELTPDANSKVDITVPTDTNDLTNGAGYITSATLGSYVTKATTQTITGQKTFQRTESQFQDSIARFVSTYNSSSAGWRGRVIIGAKDYTFLIGTYNEMAALCGHKFTNSATEEGAAWSDIYFSPDGDKAIYFGGNSWRQNSGWFKIQNSGSNTGGTVQVNIGSASSTNWKDVAYKGENISDFNNNSGFITSSALTGYATETWVGNQGYLTTSDIVSSVDSSSTNSEAVGAKLFYDTCGDIETAINLIRGV